MRRRLPPLVPLAALALILALCLVNSAVIHRHIDGFIAQLDACEALAAGERWQETEAGLTAVQAGWERFSVYLRMVSNHEDAESVSEGLSETLGYLRAGDLEDVRGVISELKTALRLIARQEELSWENVL